MFVFELTFAWKQAVFTRPDIVFACLLLFRYLRFVVHAATWLLYEPAPILPNPTYKSKDVAVVIPTVDPSRPAFLRCCESIAVNKPAVMYIVTIGDLRKAIDEILKRAEFDTRFPQTRIEILASRIANKRRQVALAASKIDCGETPITYLVDESVTWTRCFITGTLAPFEDPQVGLVGTKKKVIRHSNLPLIESYFNFIGCMKLTRANYRARSEPYIDGAIWVVSGRTCAIRSKILTSFDFLVAYQHEMFLFGRMGTLNPDDDNFITRYILVHQWKIKTQYSNDATITTELGEYPRFFSQLLRWTRTTWRSSPASLRRLNTWRRHPWSVYSIYISSLVNLALVWDPLLLCKFWQTSLYQNAASLETSVGQTALTVLMCGWILGSKLPKISAHFWEHPSDLVWLPGYYFFAYFHSLVQFWCLLTFWDHDWSGRDLGVLELRANTPMSAATPPVAAKAA